MKLFFSLNKFATFQTRNFQILIKIEQKLGALYFHCLVHKAMVMSLIMIDDTAINHDFNVDYDRIWPSALEASQELLDLYRDLHSRPETKL